MCWIISKKLRFAVLDKTCAKQRALLGCCLKLAPNRTSELSFCLKIYRINKKLKLVQDTARNCAIAWNWRQNALHNCCFSKNSSKQSAELQFYLNWLVRSETCRYLQIWNFCANQSLPLWIAKNSRLLSKTWRRQHPDKIFSLFNLKLLRKRALNYKFT